LIVSAVLIALLALSGTARAADDPVFRIEFNDGKIAPQRLEVPAKTRFKIELVNKGKTPIEFESTSLKKEKVVAPESESFIVIRTLDPGEYEFFDDFHLDTPPAVLIAK
jgi:hypothetical protein